MKKQYTVGQLASLFEMDPQLLRHYDSVGLLSPNTRNEQNNWRVYDYSQIEKLATIRYLRKLDFPLKKIEEYLHMTDYGDSLQTLQMQSEFLHNQADKLLQLDNIIQKKLNFIKQENQLLNLNPFIKKYYPERTCIMFGEEEMLYRHDLYFFHPTIVIRQGEQKSFGAYLFDDEEELLEDARKDGVQIEIIPEGCYLCTYHTGDYESFEESVELLKSEHPELKLDDTVIAINVIDQFVVSDIEKYRTEIQIQILPDEVRE
ncbi:MerR family transcriptional regulator [Mediterraneibacter agrestimuris]|uniref:MerR family transcriptional regulator n=1 Tax=Mediterraneibacter agrestimuris TaxID=2941333 RepID=UPI00203E7C39|nr:MerR family transcriptional regulator [Mediterraneibacter agrestimuris]